MKIKKLQALFLLLAGFIGTSLLATDFVGIDTGELAVTNPIAAREYYASGYYKKTYTLKIEKEYFIGKYEVTKALWDEVLRMGAGKWL
ncbi:MAG: hypothetical protein GX937_16220 [Lentisphaerae bacterium]|jgi:hypothetical protein|nr:hypothetical protein [Lentisphaerota bacterium]